MGMSPRPHAQPSVAPWLWLALGGAGVLLVGVVGTLAWVVIRTVTEGRATITPVRVAVTMTPLADGVRVAEVITADTGELPREVTIPPSQVEARYSSAVDPDETNAEAPLRDLTVDGTPVSPGGVAHPRGRVMRVTYVVERRPQGRRVAYAHPTPKHLQALEVTVRAEGSPSTCLVPEGRRTNQSYVVARECGPAPVTARRGPALAPGYSAITISAWVRVAYDPPQKETP